MKKHHVLFLSALAAFTGLAGIQARADNMASIAITPATGAVTLAPRWAISGNLAGFNFMAQDWGLTGGGANQFYSIKGSAIPSGGNIAAYTFYVAGSGAATNHVDIGSKLTPDSYSALTSADPDVGFGSVNQYLIHHKGTTDYFTVIKPGAATASSVTDLKPMSGPGGPSTVTGVSGYFGLTFAAANLGYGLNIFYYLRTDPLTGFAKFGTLAPALAGSSADQFDLGMGGYNALAFTGSDVGYGTDKMYYLRLDPITGFTIFGTLHPGTGRTADIANLGSVFSTLTFVPGDVGFGSGQFYTTGAVNPTWQSVSFAAIANRTLGAGSFTVSPSASSGLPIALTVVTGSAAISAPVAGVFTVTPLAPGRITLQATQAGQQGVYESNMLRQDFTVAGGVPDFNGDGKSDILWRNTTNGDLYVWVMNGTAYSYAVFLGNIATNWQIGGLGDFNRDGRPDILWRNATNGDLYAWVMNGTAYSYAVYLGNIAANWQIGGVGDFNGDGNPDILWRNTTNGDLYVWVMNGTAYSYAVYLGNIATNWQIGGVGDFNRDGKPDILWRNTTNGDSYVWVMNGTAYSYAVYLGNIAANWQIDGLGDFNGDGKPDIIWTNTTTGERYIWIMDGTTYSYSVYLGTIATEWSVGN